MEKGGVPGNMKDIISEVPGDTGDIIKVSEMVLTPVVQSKFLFNTNKVINAGMKEKSGTKKAEEASSINEQEPEQMEDRDLDKTKPKTNKVKYPCAICEGNVRSNARECKGCYKWVHHRCHIANNGIGWNDDPEKTDYRCPNCLKNIAGVIQRMMTKRGI